ncbi:MAG: ATP-binding cassette domain-containing protein [Actinobacteria bacterium]|nr:ATP-binding cassette domain-containing protein [Actinomycetota bacterium]
MPPPSGGDEPAPIYGPAAPEGSEDRSHVAGDSPYFKESGGDLEPLSQQDRGEEETLSREVALPGSAAASAGSASNPQARADEPASDSDYEWEQPGARGEGREAATDSSRMSVVDEPTSRPAPPAGASEEEYRWHTYRVYPSGRPDAVEFIDTYKAFGRNRILRGLNMGLPEGMVSMILGPSGTGKSVCIKHMVGLLYPDQGDILVHGESVPNMPDDDLFDMRKKFGLLFQDGALFGSMNLYDNVCFPLRQHTEKGEDEVEDIVMRRLNEVGLGSAREKYPNELSGGMRKRAGFARALVLEPDIVLFDEPDSGLDPVRTALLGELILEIHRDMMEEAKAKQREHLPTFAVITHDIMSARRVADYINVLWKGRIVEAGPAEDMLNSENPFIRQFLAGESQGPLTMD